MNDMQTALAFHRFGLGARPGDMARLTGPVRTALLDEVRSTATPSPFSDMQTSAELLVRFMDFRGERRAVRLEAASRMAGETGMQPPRSVQDPAMMTPAAPAVPAPQAPGAKPAPVQPRGPAAALPPNPVQIFSQEELAARLQSAVTAGIGFKERLALFWSNHFTVAGVNPRVRIVCGSFEREAIRPHIAGRFEDMLQAAESHPAMLMYLDNAQSIGPTSQAGRNRKRGLNENLAREILELHTLGVDGGYSQADVTRFAEILTGWTMVGAQANGGEPGTFLFRPQMHEPGSRKVLGRDYPQAGMDQGKAVLSDLARHPSTARHVATKLVRHFIADVPPPAAVKRVQEAFTSSGGQLMAVYEALLSAPEAWEPTTSKLRTPYEYAVALYRALKLPLLLTPETGTSGMGAGTVAVNEINQITRLLTLTGQPVFAPPSPKGWPEEATAWAAPDAFKTRLDMAENAARRVATLRPLELAEDVLGARLTDETRTAIRRAETSYQGLALMLMSPEFQRR
jgi:uncharacterized protein (DUF1800 family)